MKSWLIERLKNSNFLVPVLVNTRPVSEANDVPCYIDNHFVCELDDSISDVNALSQIDAKLLKPLTNYSRQNHIQSIPLVFSLSMFY